MGYIFKNNYPHYHDMNNELIDAHLFRQEKERLEFVLVEISS